MEVKSYSSNQDNQKQEIMSTNTKEDDDVVVGVDDEEGPLPGFRFHPTDEELVSFYLKRKVEKRRPLSIEIIKQVDIYKHDPWDLASMSFTTQTFTTTLLIHLYFYYYDIFSACLSNYFCIACESCKSMHMLKLIKGFDYNDTWKHLKKDGWSN